MKHKTMTWLQGLSNTGRILLAAGLLAIVGVVNAAANAPEITTKQITTVERIAFATERQDDETLLTTETNTIQAGSDGVKRVTYSVTYSGDKEIKREKQREQITKPAVHAVIATGVKTVELMRAAEVVPFTSSTKSDANLAKGVRQVIAAGQNGERTISYEVIKVRGIEVSRKQVNSEITKQSINEVVAVGTKVTVAPKTQVSSSCDKNYAGACVPIASDVDCGSGSGNGPAYLYGVARVVGSDIYDLDRDGDGLACE